MDAFERLKKEREREGQSVRPDPSQNYAPTVPNQKNIYSGNNYQNRDTTYENQLLMTKETMKEIERHYHTIVDELPSNIVID